MQDCLTANMLHVQVTAATAISKNVRRPWISVLASISPDCEFRAGRLSKIIADAKHGQSPPNCKIVCAGLKQMEKTLTT
jgi:hypothetical protein